MFFLALVNYLPVERGGFYALLRWRVPSLSILMAALTSLSISAPHSQECHLSSSVFLHTVPQLEQTWLV